MKLRDLRSQVTPRDMRVPLRRGDGAMAEKLLDRPQIGAAVEELGRDGVAEHVRSDGLLDTRGSRQLLERVGDALGGERTAQAIEKERLVLDHETLPTREIRAENLPRIRIG